MYLLWYSNKEVHPEVVDSEEEEETEEAEVEDSEEEEEEEVALIEVLLNMSNQLPFTTRLLKDSCAAMFLTRKFHC